MKNLIQQFKLLLKSKAQIEKERTELVRNEQEKKEKKELARLEQEKEENRLKKSKEIEKRMKKIELLAENEVSFWENVKKVNSEEAVRSYITEYPNGKFVDEAIASLNKLKNKSKGNVQNTEVSKKVQEKKKTIELNVAMPKMDWGSYEIQRKSVDNIIERKIQSSTSDIFFMLNLGGDILTKSIHGVTSGLFEEISRHLANPITGVEATSISQKIRKSSVWVTAFDNFLNDKSNASKGLPSLLRLFAKLSLDFYDNGYMSNAEAKSLKVEPTPNKSLNPEKKELHDTQLVLENWNPLLFPALSGEKVFYGGEEISLSRWFEIYKDEELFIWALPEKDFGEPRYPNYPKNWNIFRDAPTREKMEKEFIEIYVHYAKILVSYNNQNLLSFRSQGQYLTANLSTVWLTMASKYKMLRREFVALHEAVKPRLKEALQKAFK